MYYTKSVNFDKIDENAVHAVEMGITIHIHQGKFSLLLSTNWPDDFK